MVGFVLVPGPGLRGSVGISEGTSELGTSVTVAGVIPLTRQLVARGGHDALSQFGHGGPLVCEHHFTAIFHRNHG